MPHPSFLYLCQSTWDVNLSALIFLGENLIPKTGFEFQRISIDRSKMSEEEAFEHAIEMIQTRQMGFRKAADFFSVSDEKSYVLKNCPFEQLWLFVTVIN